MTKASLINDFRSAVEHALLNLLENKYLYQSVKVDIEGLEKKIKQYDFPIDGSGFVGSSRTDSKSIQENQIESFQEQQEKLAENLIVALSNNEWKWIEENHRKGVILRPIIVDSSINEPQCIIPHFKRDCPNCSAISPAHNPGWPQSLKNEPLVDLSTKTNKPKIINQVWVFSFQC